QQRLPGKMLAYLYSRNVCGYRLKDTAILQRRFGLQVIRLQMRRTAVQVQQDNRRILAAAFSSRAGFEDIRQCEASEREDARAQDRAARNVAVGGKRDQHGNHPASARLLCCVCGRRRSGYVGPDAASIRERGPPAAELLLDCRGRAALAIGDSGTVTVLLKDFVFRDDEL